MELDLIRTDANTQTPFELNEDAVTDYVEQMQAGDQFPAVVVFHDGSTYFLADGFHRCMAAQRLGLQVIEASVQPGTRLEALEYALGANRSKGLRRTNADKRRCVMMDLEHFSSLSDRAISEMCGVGKTLVRSIRGKVVEKTTCQTRTGMDGKEYGSRSSRQRWMTGPQAEAVPPQPVVTDGAAESAPPESKREVGWGLMYPITTAPDDAVRPCGCPTRRCVHQVLEAIAANLAAAGHQNTRCGDCVEMRVRCPARPDPDVHPLV